MSAINDQQSGIDRCGELRTHPETLEKLWAQSKILHFTDGRISSEGQSLRFLKANEVEALIASGEFAEGEKYFLGKALKGSQSYFAWRSEPTKKEDDATIAKSFSSLRDIWSFLDPLETEIALHTVALSNWHQTHSHCARCGAQTSSDLGGAVRVCAKDQSQHHPRTDSAAIVLVKDGEDRILLGHQPVWPEGRFSCFAGFLEPGETFEQCVAREVYEESGVKINNISYLGSQPWPFPASIMIAFEADVVDAQSARPDGQEITEVKWFTRAELKAQAADGTLLLPAPMSVAYKMIERWFAQGDSSPLVSSKTWR